MVSQVEQKIIQLIRVDDRSFVSMIYDHYADNLYGVILAIVKDEQMAQDVLQESFLKIWKNAKRFDEKKARLFTYLLRICRNTAIDKLRSAKVRERMEIQTQTEHVYNDEDRSTDYAHLNRLLGGLEEKYLDVIVAIFFQGKTQMEASEDLDLPLGTVKTRLKIGLRELRKHKGKLTIIFLTAFLMS